MFRQFVLLSLIMTAAASGAEYLAITTSDTALRAAPSVNALQVATLPAGTAVSVSICFREGDYCHVTGAAFDGYAAGDLLRVDDESISVLAAETARWELIRRERELDLVAEWETEDIVVWGDSLSTNTLGDPLRRLLPGRDVSMQGAPGENGRQIADRMLADYEFVHRLKIIWDRHYTGQRADTYLDELKPLLDRAAATGDFILVSDMRQLYPSDGIPDPATDAAVTAGINEQLSRLYPDNFVDLTAILEDPETRNPDGLHLSLTGSERVARALAAAIEARRPR
jgi:hypothetical protein